MSEKTIDRCSYEHGPCQSMADHSRPSTEGKRAGIVAQDNRCLVTDPELRLFHAGCALFGSPDQRVRKSGVMLNFCPWCGADLMQWHEDFRKALDARREEIKA